MLCNGTWGLAGLQRSWALCTGCQSMSRAATLCCEYIKTQFPAEDGWLWRDFWGLMPLQACLHRAGWQHQGIFSRWTLLRYLSLKASLLVHLTEVTVWVLWRQVSRSVQAFTAERSGTRKSTTKKRDTAEEGEYRREIRTLHSPREGRGDCPVYKHARLRSNITQQV